jgi:DNA polymerase-1
MKVLLLDGYNMLYRARSGHAPFGDNAADSNSITYTFFRSLRHIVDTHKPDRVYFVLEGMPKDRIAMHEEYKAQRVYHDRDGFQRQRKKIIEIVSSYLPVHVVRHADYECDDVLAAIAQHTHADDECVVVSTDTDFFQLFNTCKNVRIYNPIKKSFVEPVDYDYVTYKALKGDSSDNIEGFKGIGDKRAKTLVASKDSLNAFLAESENREKFNKNCFLIKFHDLEQKMTEITDNCSAFLANELCTVFNDLGFQSITNDISWKKYTKTFADLV